MGKSNQHPVIVEGTAVSASPYDHHTTTTAVGVEHGHGGGGVGGGVGEKQATRCRDPAFAFLLYGNVGAIAAVAAIYGADAFTEAIGDTTAGENSESGYSYTGYMYATFILGAIAMVFTGITLPIMMCIPTLLIKVSLLMMLVLSGLMMAYMFVSGSIIGGIIGAIFFLITCCYTKCVWSRIPFASINLLTACTAIRKNAGVILVSYFFVILAFGWTLLWAVALMGVWDKVVTEQQQEVTQAGGTTYTYTSAEANYGYLFLLFLSYFFTHQVIQNTTHVTVAGTVGAWWFSPDQSGCCASGMIGSLLRSLTTSFGSICFGSLLVAIIQALRALADSARNNENQILVCIAMCILGCLESLLEYFNKWAFVYVGLYGYSYLEAGKNVFTLFKNRGWEAIIADDLVGNVFFILSLCVGGICSAIGYGAFNGDQDLFANSVSPETVPVTCAVLGFVAGLVLASILMSTIASAVNTVIVCFAEGPAEFEANHPELSRKMRETWLQFYPDCGV